MSFGLQCASVVVERGFSIKATAKRMLPGSLRDYGLALATWGSLAAMLVVFYDTAGLLALVAFVPVALLARQTLARSQALLETKRAFADREDALVQLSQHIVDERADERQLIAGQLHDDVLQALFKVTLMGEVLKRDLTMGRLLDLETDLREMAEAGEAASAAVRDVISNVRKSDLGTGTVADAIKALLGRVSSEATIRVSSQIGELRGDPRAQLTVYQITKEAIENATRHSRCDSLDVWLRQDSDRLALVISDDGVGFDPAKVADGHYGLQIMRERAQSASGSLYIDSWPGQGCKVTAILPTDPSPAPRSG
jgi:signal transduction histidine kinase